jgi:HK97 gp10 family phage protein
MPVPAGAKAHLARLKRMANLKDKSARALGKVAELIRYEWQSSIREGAISGPGHIPSLPGEPSNADTHELDSNIRTRVARDGKSAAVISTAPHAAFQEFGTSKMAARPAGGPAARKHGPKLSKILNDEVKLTISRR